MEILLELCQHYISTYVEIKAFLCLSGPATKRLSDFHLFIKEYMMNWYRNLFLGRTTELTVSLQATQCKEIYSSPYYRTNLNGLVVYLYRVALACIPDCSKTSVRKGAGDFSRRSSILISMSEEVCTVIQTKVVTTEPRILKTKYQFNSVNVGLYSDSYRGK